MEPIYDHSWMRQMITARIRERFTFHNYRAVAMEMLSGTIQRSPYLYRILFFPHESQKPVLSLNLESSILGSCCLTEQYGKEHLNLGRADNELSYDDFKKWALQRAKKELN